MFSYNFFHIIGINYHNILFYILIYMFLQNFEYLQKNSNKLACYRDCMKLNHVENHSMPNSYLLEIYHFENLYFYQTVHFKGILHIFFILILYYFKLMKKNELNKNIKYIFFYFHQITHHLHNLNIKVNYYDNFHLEL